MYGRAVARELEETAARMPIVTITGPRQSDKTTLVREVFPNVDYVSLERPDERLSLDGESVNHRIRVAGHLGPESRQLAEGMAIEVHRGSDGRAMTVLVGPVADEAALMGILEGLYLRHVTSLLVSLRKTKNRQLVSQVVVSSQIGRVAE
jgi:hypothetical protein